MPSFTDLPVEITIRVLNFLNINDLLTCQRVSRLFHTTIATSLHLQHNIACAIAGVEDNPSCLLSLQQRHDRLLSREQAWNDLTFDLEQDIAVPHRPSGIYDLTGGVFLLGDPADLPPNNTRNVRWVRLPDSEESTPVWNTIDVGAPIVDIGLCVLEHDLIAIVTWSPSVDHDGQPMEALDVHIIQLSTGRPHPAASVPRLHIPLAASLRPIVGIEIVGVYLALTVAFGPHSGIDDTLWIWEWMSGKLVHTHTALPQSYQSLVFLTPTALLLPNSRAGALEIWTIRTDGAQRVVTLLLPALAAGRRIHAISARCEPNPYLHIHKSHSQLPFLPRPDDALVTFTLYTAAPASSISFGALRQSFLAFLPPPSPLPSLPADIPYDAWGATTTRWFDGSVALSRWITVAAGARWFLLPAFPSTTAVVTDFSPLRLRRTARGLDGSVSAIGASIDQGSTGGDGGDAEEDEDAWMLHGDDGPFKSSIFAEPVRQGLPFRSRVIEELGDIDGVLMDEDRLISVHTDFTQRITDLHILHVV